MPELPEVETLKRELAKVLVGKKIVKVTVKWPKMVKPLSIRNFINKVTGHTIKAVERRVKVLIITLNDSNHLLIHLKMTGQLIYGPKKGRLIAGGHPQPQGLDNLPNKFTHIWFDFSDGATLFFNDMRKFGWIKHFQNHEREAVFKNTGIEPLSKQFTLAVFKNLLAKYPKRKLKQFLLDQTIIAGLGNIYVDEACFLSGILPTRAINSLTSNEIMKLHHHIVGVLKLSVSKKGTSAKNYVRSDGSKGGFVPYLNVYGRAKLPCKKCGTPITKIKFAGRGTHYCSHCQK